LSGIFSTVLFAILEFFNIILFETIRHGLLGFIFGGLAGIVIAVVLAVVVLVFSVIGGFIGGAITR
jgi:hypothetical protein